MNTGLGRFGGKEFPAKLASTVSQSVGGLSVLDGDDYVDLAAPIIEEALGWRLGVQGPVSVDRSLTVALTGLVIVGVRASSAKVLLCDEASRTALELDEFLFREAAGQYEFAFNFVSAYEKAVFRAAGKYSPHICLTLRKKSMASVGCLPSGRPSS